MEYIRDEKTIFPIQLINQTMIKTLQNDFKEIEASRELLFNDLKKYTEDQLNFKPTENEWSILQVMNHLMMAEVSSVVYVQKKLTNGLADIPKMDAEGDERFAQLASYMQADNRTSAPPMVTPTFERTTLAATREGWDTIRQDTATQLERFGEADLNKAAYKHLLAGRMSIVQMLGFFRLHFNRHLGQIERIKAAMGTGELGN